MQEKKRLIWDKLNLSTGQIVVLLKSKISKLNVICQLPCYDNHGMIGDEAARDIVIDTEKKKINSCQKPRKVSSSLPKRVKRKGGGAEAKDTNMDIAT